MEIWVQGAASGSLCLLSGPGIGASNVQKLYPVCEGSTALAPVCLGVSSDSATPG